MSSSSTRSPIHRGRSVSVRYSKPAHSLFYDRLYPLLACLQGVKSLLSERTEEGGRTVTRRGESSSKRARQGAGDISEARNRRATAGEFLPSQWHDLGRVF